MTYTPKYFKWSEFDQKDYAGSGFKHMDHTFVKKLDNLRLLCGFPLVINSAYRSPEYNEKVSKSGLSGPHTTGKAVDIRCIDKKTRYKLLREAFDLGFKGIGVSRTFIHLDDCDYPARPNLWIYDKDGTIL